MTNPPAILEAILVDGGPETYKKWANDYEADVKAIKYDGPTSANTKWRSYHAQLLESGRSASQTKHRIFDAGCGTGLVGEDLMKTVSADVVEIHGGDLCPELLEKAKEKKVYTDLKVVNLKEELPYEADYFDSILCVGTFLQGHCGAECLPNLVRVLKKGCYLVATVRSLFYNETKSEWDRQIRECNCKLLEDDEMPYHDESKAVVLVIHKQ